MFKIQYYDLPSGKEPARAFLGKLPKDERWAAFAHIKLLEEYGNQIGMPESRAMGNGLFELRVKLDNGQIRLFYFFVAGRICVITNGFKKKSKKTPSRYLYMARKYKKEYESRNIQ